MTRIFSILIMLAASCLVGVAQNVLTEKELDKLDAEIEQKHIYDNQKYERIAILEETANSSAKFSNERFDALFDLGKGGGAKGCVSIPLESFRFFF